jgi:hypothetical protein
MIDVISGARALHERLFRATITKQGETRVPTAIGRARQKEILYYSDWDLMNHSEGATL